LIQKLACTTIIRLKVNWLIK